ncbi:hypothetical protein [Cryobacterium sp. AP23]
MARAHGFRVFVVQAYPNQKKDKDPLNVSKSSAVRNEVIELLERLQERGTQSFEGRVPADGSPSKPTVTLTVHEPYVVRADLVHVSVAMGETGSHRMATRASKKPKNLEGWSPEADHKVTLLFPKGTDTRFLLIVEVIHRRDPHRRLLSMLSRESLRRRQEAEEQERNERATIRASGVTPPPRQAHARLLFDAKQAADNEYLDSILSSADSATATFKSTVASNRGSNRPTVDRILKITLRDADVKKVGRGIGRKWAGRLRKGESTSQTEGVSELAALLYERDLLEEDEGDRYESAAISVRSDAHETTTIAVDTLRDVFTYPVADSSPDTYYYYDRVAPRVATIARQERLEVQKIDAREVDSCLRDSIPDR